MLKKKYTKIDSVYTENLWETVLSTLGPNIWSKPWCHMIWLDYGLLSQISSPSDWSLLVWLLRTSVSLLHRDNHYFLLHLSFEIPPFLSIYGASYFRLLSFVCSFAVSCVTHLIAPQSIFLVLQTERQLSNLIIWPPKSSSNRPSHMQGKIWAYNSDKQDLFWSDPQSASASATQATTPLYPHQDLPVQLILLPLHLAYTALWSHIWHCEHPQGKSSSTPPHD